MTNLKSLQQLEKKTERKKKKKKIHTNASKRDEREKKNLDGFIMSEIVIFN